MILAPNQLEPRKFNDVALDTNNFTSTFEFFATFYKNVGDGRAIPEELFSNVSALNAVQKCVTDYQNLMVKKGETKSPLTLDVLRSFHEEAKTKSLNYYDQVTDKSDPIAAVYRTSLVKDLDGIYKASTQGFQPKVEDKQVSVFWERFCSSVGWVMQKIVSLYSTIANIISELWTKASDDTKANFSKSVFEFLTRLLNPKLAVT